MASPHKPPSDRRSPQPPPERPRSSPRGMIAWAFYDWASNSYATVVLTFVFAAYFTRRVAPDETTGSIYWGLTLGIAGFFVGLGAPIIGATADQTGRRKPAIVAFTLVAIAVMSLLWFVAPSPDYILLGLLLVAVGELGIEYAGVLYNAMLPSLVPRSRVGRWSGWGWSMGYAGGLLCLVAVLVLFIREENPWWALDREQAHHVRAAFLLAAAWFLLFSLPLMFLTPDESSTGVPLRRAVRDGLRQIRDSLRNVRRYVNIVKFLIARLIYIDGLATLFVYGGVYAAGVFDMTEERVLLFGIALNVTAGIGAVAFSWIDDWIGGRRTIILALVGLIIPGTWILLVESESWFWGLGLTLGLFVGPLQAASRSYMSRVAPEQLRNQMFGLYAFSGKVAFFCPALVAGLTWISGSLRFGMSAIIVFFVIGLALVLTIPASAEHEN